MGLNPAIVFLNIYFLAREVVESKDNEEVEVNDGCIKLTDRSSYYIWQYFTVPN